MIISTDQIRGLPEEELLLRARASLMAYQMGLSPTKEVKDNLLLEIDELLARVGLVPGWGARGGNEK